MILSTRILPSSCRRLCNRRWSCPSHSDTRIVVGITFLAGSPHGLSAQSMSFSQPDQRRIVRLFHRQARFSTYAVDGAHAADGNHLPLTSSMRTFPYGLVIDSGSEDEGWIRLPRPPLQGLSAAWSSQFHTRPDDPLMWHLAHRDHPGLYVTVIPYPLHHWPKPRLRQLIRLMNDISADALGVMNAPDTSVEGFPYVEYGLGSEYILSQLHLTTSVLLVHAKHRAHYYLRLDEYSKVKRSPIGLASYSLISKRDAYDFNIFSSLSKLVQRQHIHTLWTRAKEKQSLLHRHFTSESTIPVSTMPAILHAVPIPDLYRVMRTDNGLLHEGVIKAASHCSPDLHVFQQRCRELTSRLKCWLIVNRRIDLLRMLQGKGDNQNPSSSPLMSTNERGLSQPESDEDSFNLDLLARLQDLKMTRAQLEESNQMLLSQFAFLMADGSREALTVSLRPQAKVSEDGHNSLTLLFQILSDHSSKISESNLLHVLNVYLRHVYSNAFAPDDVATLEGVMDESFAKCRCDRRIFCVFNATPNVQTNKHKMEPRDAFFGRLIYYFTRNLPGDPESRNYLLSLTKVDRERIGFRIS